MKRRHLLSLAPSIIICPSCNGHKEPLPTFNFANARGLNIIDLCGPGWYPPEKFQPAEFALLQQHGFNHVRLLVDSHFFTQQDNPRTFDPDRAKKLDEGIQLARKHQLHTTLALFSVPGFSVNQQNQAPSLWNDPALQKTFISLWQTLAKRYRDIPNSQLSFNLINENPWSLLPQKYTTLMARAIEAIREISPERPIIIDGLKSGREPIKEFINIPHLIQSAHFYEPFELTHHQADWLSDSPRFPPATTWPLPRIPHHLFGSAQEYHSPLTLQGDFSGITELTLQLGEVLLSPQRPLTLSLIGTETTKQTLKVQSSWKQENDIPEHQLIQYWADSSISISIPKNNGTLFLSVSSGDRLTFRSLTIGKHLLTPSSREWTSQPAPIDFSPGHGFKARKFYDKNWIKHELQRIWKPCLDAKQPVIVQEFGCNHAVPHNTAAAYLSDCRSAFEELKLGWAAYSNTGTLGILRSPRRDGKHDDLLFKLLAK